MSLLGYCCHPEPGLTATRPRAVLHCADIQGHCPQDSSGAVGPLSPLPHPRPEAVLCFCGSKRVRIAGARETSLFLVTTLS